MAIQKKDIVDININTGNIHRSFLNHTIGSADIDADRFGFRVFRDGEEVDLSGCSCYGYFRNSQGENIALTEHGTVYGNEAYVTLPQACYNYEGQFCLSIKLIGGGVTGTMRIIDGVVDNTNTGSAIAPTETVPTYTEILEVYDELVAAAAVANEAIAPEFAQGTANAENALVINDGALYVLPDGHTAGETWAETEKEQTTMGDQITYKAMISDTPVSRGELTSASVTTDTALASISEGIYMVNNVSQSYLPEGAARYGTLLNIKSKNGYGSVIYVDTNGIISCRHFYWSGDPAVYTWHSGWKLFAEGPATKLMERYGVLGNGNIPNDNALMGLNYGTYMVNASGASAYLPSGFLTTGTLVNFKSSDAYSCILYIDSGSRAAIRHYYTSSGVNTWNGPWNIITTSAINGIHVGNNTPLENVISGASILQGTFTLNSEVSLAAGQTIIGAKNCVITCGADAKLVMANGSSITGVHFVGSWSPSRTTGDGTTYTSYGYVPLISMEDLSEEDDDTLFGEGNTKEDAVVFIPQDAAWNTRIDGCRFQGFEKPAIYAGGLRHKEVTNPVICNNYFIDCWTGIVVDGEFERIYANEYFRCIIGAYLLAANINQVGEIYKCCDCAIYFPTESVAHNEITSMETAHCGLAGIYIKVLSKRMGCQVTGCHIVDAPVIGESVSNLLITGGRLDTYFKYISGQHNSIICSNVGKDYLYGNTLYDVPADTLITLNRGLYDVPDSEVNVTT